MEYKPRPIDTSQITLSDDVLELTELLAKNTHEIWAQQRLSEGWRYGAERNDERREHPGLVSYEELSEVEKQYDRNTALETLKTILSLGYRIEPPARSAERDAALAAMTTGDTDAILEAFKRPGALDLSGLLAVWQARDAARWARSPELYRHLAERLVKLGEMLLAYDVVSEGRKFWASDLRLRQLQALALTRIGATVRANNLLAELYREGQRDEETVGMLARTHKDLWQQATDAEERERQLQQSYKFYEEAYRLSGGYWTGINAATIALLSGEREHARALAAEVRERCVAALDELEATGGDTYWPLATLGEAALVSEDWEEAARWYERAAATGRRQLGELTSTRRNARLITDYLGGDKSFIDRHLPAPRVVVFDGGDATREGEAAAWRMPAGVEANVRAAILARLNELNAGVGYAAVPSFGDATFLEAMLEAGGETHAILPYHLSELFKTEHAQGAEQAGHADAQGGDDGDESQATRAARYESLLRRVTSKVEASEQNMSASGMSDEYARLLLQGLALIRAKQLDTELVALTLPEDANDQPFAARPHAGANAHDVQTAEASGFKARMAALLFADAVNFSKLTEAQIPVFVRDFLGAVGTLVSNFQPAPLLKNTWGDGLYLVFEDVQSAGRFALDLSDLLNATDWTERGLPADLNLRIALHAGPVYGCTDPVTQKDNFIGTHVSRAARIEPITPPGQVYASQAFAALAAAQRVADFTCDYVGQTPLAKKYGTFPTYHVRRQHAART
ncbi:MAG TPA: TRAFs-binding domain-containing protein [Pyrinomonadaceae bacterium]|nr:TRAFs-binding domain-containing protein [Pyrinomonadaceae bacterium]